MMPHVTAWPRIQAVTLPIGSGHGPVPPLLRRPAPAKDVPRLRGNVLPRAGRPERCVVLLEAVRGQGQEKAAAGEGSGMKAGRDPRVGRWFWRAETEWHRWRIRAHFWLAPGNMLKLNRQPRFTEVMIGRCVVLCHSRTGPRNWLPPRPDVPSPAAFPRLLVISRRKAVQIPRCILRCLKRVRAAGNAMAAAHRRILALTERPEFDSAGPRARVRHVIGEVRNEGLDHTVAVVRGPAEALADVILAFHLDLSS